MNPSVRYSRFRRKCRVCTFLLEFGAVCLWGVWGLAACLGLEAAWAAARFLSQPAPTNPSPNFLKWQAKQRERERAEWAKKRDELARPLSLSDKVFGFFFLSALVLAIPAALGLFS